MSKVKTTFVSGLLMLCLIPGKAIADVKVSFKIQGDWAYVAAGDVNCGTQAYFDWRRSFWPASEGGYRALHHGFELGGDVIFELSRTIGIGIGSGYLEASRVSRMDVWFPDRFEDGVLIAEPKLSIAPIRFGLFLNFPLKEKINFTTNFGIFYCLKARFSADWKYWHSVMDAIFDDTVLVTFAEKRGIPLGLNGGMGIEYKLVSKVFVCLSVQGRYARFRGMEGSSEFSSLINDPFYEQGKLYYESVPTLPDAPRLIMVQSDPPEGPDGEPRLAVVDFSGVSLQAGIRIRL